MLHRPAFGSSFKVLSCLMIGALFASGCTSPGKNTAVGAGVGAGVGAAAGAIIGHQSGNRGKGAIIGAGLGGLLGGGVGNYLDKQAKELEKIAETKRTDNGIITKLKGDVLFDSGSAVLKPAAANQIDQLGAVLKKYPENRLVIVGHTDNLGRPETNKVLSEQRAQAVMLQIVKAGVAKETINTVGMGSSQPVANNKTAPGRAQNRRVEIQISVPQEASGK